MVCSERVRQNLGKAAKIKMDRKPAASEMTILIGGSFIASLVTAYVLAHVTFLSHSFFKNDSFLQDALATAFWLWVGLTVARIFVHDIFEGRPWKLMLLTVGHELVTLLAMGLIIGWLGVK